jgi:hypothetical protein
MIVASFLADSFQSPIRSEFGSFLKINDKFYKIGGLHMSKLEYLGFLCDVTRAEDIAQHPNRKIYGLTKFTAGEQDAVCDILSMVLEMRG